MEEEDHVDGGGGGWWEAVDVGFDAADDVGFVVRYCHGCGSGAVMGSAELIGSIELDLFVCYTQRLPEFFKWGIGNRMCDGD